MKQRAIFICGADMTGKTQIAKALAKRLRIDYFKASSEHESYKISSGLIHLDPGPHYDHTNSDHLFLNNFIVKNPLLMESMYADPRMVDLFTQCEIHAVLDRGYPCEYAYAKVFNRPTVPIEHLQKLDKKWAELGAKIIICHRTSYDGIVDDLDKRINQEKLEELDSAYQSFVTWTKCSTLLLNVDDENLERELSDVMNWLEA